MKRTLAMLLAVALACSVIFAGSAAAQEFGIDDLEQEIEQDAELEQDAEAEVDQEQDVDQTNVGLQGGNVALSVDDGDATAGNTLDQTNNNQQVGDAIATNDGELDQEADHEVEYELDF